MRLRKALPDVPCASLYRHIKISANSSVLEAAGENRIAVGYMKRRAAKVGKMRQCGKSALKKRVRIIFVCLKRDDL